MNKVTKCVFMSVCTLVFTFMLAFTCCIRTSASCCNDKCWCCRGSEEPSWAMQDAKTDLDNRLASMRQDSENVTSTTTIADADKSTTMAGADKSTTVGDSEDKNLSNNVQSNSADQSTYKTSDMIPVYSFVILGLLMVSSLIGLWVARKKKQA